MNKLEYVAPRIEVYEMERDGFIAGGSNPVTFSNNSSADEGFVVQKGGSIMDDKEEL